MKVVNLWTLSSLKKRYRRVVVWNCWKVLQDYRLHLWQLWMTQSVSTLMLVPVVRGPCEYHFARIWILIFELLRHMHDDSLLIHTQLTDSALA